MATGMLSGFWNSLFRSRQDELNEEATEESIFQMKHPFARIMEDASNYGLNPMTALGSQPSSAQFSGSSSQSAPSDILGLVPALIAGAISRENNKETSNVSRDNNSDNNSTQLKALQEQLAQDKKKHDDELKFQKDKWDDEKKLLYKQIDDLNQKLDWQIKHGTVIGAPEKIAIADTGATVVNNALDSVSSGSKKVFGKGNSTVKRQLRQAKAARKRKSSK